MGSFDNSDGVIKALREDNLTEVERTKVGSTVTNDHKSELDKYLPKRLRKIMNIFKVKILVFWTGGR